MGTKIYYGGKVITIFKFGFYLSGVILLNAFFSWLFYSGVYNPLVLTLLVYAVLTPVYFSIKKLIKLVVI